jgi:hypothetical protein
MSPLNSCYERTLGMFYFARMCSKIRAHAAGELPASYFEMLGQGFDGRTCRYLGVTYDQIKGWVLAGNTDQDALALAFATGRSLNAEEILIYNSFMSKRGWRDDETAEFIPAAIREYGLPDDGSIITDFDLIEMDEGRWTPDLWKSGWSA